MNSLSRLGLGLSLVLFAMPIAANAQVVFCGPVPCPPPLSITSDITGSAAVGTPIQIQFTGNPFITSDHVAFATTSDPTLGTLGTITNDTDTTATATYTPTAEGTETFTFEADEFDPTDPSTIINTGNGTVTVTVSAGSGPTPDTTAPAITVPATQTFATTTFPATPTLIQATAIDDVDGAVAVQQSPTTFAEGTSTVTWTARDSAGNTATATSTVVVNAQATLAVRDGSTLIGPFTITLPATDTPAVALFPTGSTTSYTVPARSVLALLADLDSSHAEFDITDLSYFNSFSSFLLNCMSIAAISSSPQCFSWTYAVNGAFPSVGMDHTTLSAGDSAYVFFGDSWKVSADKSSVNTGESVTITAQYYDASSNSFLPAVGQTVGAVQFDNNFNFTEFATSTTDASGQATITLTNPGTYSLGVAATGYFPNVSLSVNAPVAGSNPSGGGGGGGIAHGLFSVPRALAYLGTVQHADGSFDNDVLSDWAALALAAQDASGMKAKLSNYLTSATPSMSNVTDYERHAMALEALGINPFTGASTDYISPIVSTLSSASCDASYIGADIFAIFPLLHAGYSTSDSVIQNAVACIVASQSSNGSWNDPDTTSAAIQALALVSGLPNTTNASAKAQAYLKTQEQSSGSFGSTPSTSWALQAIAALGQSESSWAPSGSYPSDYLATMQQTDGGVELNSKDSFTRAWATEYAIPGVLGKTWNSLLGTFSRPSTGSGSGGSAASTATTTAATSTTATSSAATSTTATATAPIASTTPAVTTALIVIPSAKTLTTATPTTHAPAPTRIVTLVATTTEATTTSTTTPSTQVAAAATVASFDWRQLFYLILGFLALCGLSWLAYTLVVKRG